MSKFKIKVKLIQQSPILHFQARQAGVSLRASEVKPKLDRYIISRHKDSIDKSWYLRMSSGSGRNSLDYRMKIAPSGAQTVMSSVPQIYYGNMGESNRDSAFCLKGDCELTVMCFHEGLKNLIEQELQGFFLCHNFGRMQNKGFGSYITEDTDLTNLDSAVSKALTERLGSRSCYVLSGYREGSAYPRSIPGGTDRNGKPKFRVNSKIFDDIKNLYQVMKSGYNFGSYHRSVLFEYFHDMKTGSGQNIVNEKAYIKRKGITPRYFDRETRRVDMSMPYYKKHPYKGGPDDGSKAMARFVRIVLGLGESYTYQPSRDTIRIVPEDETMERYASPIFFKIAGNNIYIAAGRSDSGIFDKKFTFESRYGSEELYTVSEDMFDIDEFMDYFQEKFNNVHTSDGNSDTKPINEILGINKLMEKVR